MSQSFEAADIDNDGYISKAEWIRAHQTGLPRAPEELAPGALQAASLRPVTAGAAGAEILYSGVDPSQEPARWGEWEGSRDLYLEPRYGPVGKSDAVHALRQLRGLLQGWRLVVVQRGVVAWRSRSPSPSRNRLEEDDGRASRLARWQNDGSGGKADAVDGLR